MRIRRLGWAGIEVEYDDSVIVVDLLENDAPLSPELAFEFPLTPPTRLGRTDGALVSHLHADHTDAAALQRALRPNAPVYRPESEKGPFGDEAHPAAVEAELRKHGLHAETVAEWDSRTVGPFRVTAVPAIDGLGDPQVSWVIDTGDLRIFHGGDTMFHGFWWSIARRLGPIDVAFMPINGPTLEEVPNIEPPSPLPAVLTPEQAAIAAHLLGAKRAVPIHYGLDKPPLYAQAPDAVNRFRRQAAELGLEAIVLEPGEDLYL
ncbi:MBL fold metallo-hydrolase [Arthrobacter zhaoguopingii]|uniref:MBL fold metallo-hydrolase n=1 Tax=Arthrobacter zhaoguopingii TaxID=2681491 RepID=UPI001356CD18|nr:MBL fold metallo-hydrolase [Arthrobacter zhaoguopingii]